MREKRAIVELTIARGRVSYVIPLACHLLEAYRVGDQCYLGDNCRASRCRWRWMIRVSALFNGIIDDVRIYNPALSQAESGPI
jgi:hypothetical protein